MTFTEFRNNDALRGWADSLSQSPEWNQLLAILLKEQHPMYWPAENNETSASRQLGRIEGFNHTLSLIAKAGRKPAADPITQIPVTFLTEQPTTATKSKAHARKH